jgi:hypothetical protein
MREPEYRLLEVVRRDLAFLRSVGIAPCLIDGPLPEPLPPSCPEQAPVRLTDADARWLKACGIAWERAPESQLALGFCQPPPP